MNRDGITREQWLTARDRALAYLDKAGIVLTGKEKEDFEVADFGLGDLERLGLEIVTYVNTNRCCAKELVLFPGQTCPEHRHPPVAGEPGKEETFRCRYGKVYLYVEGPPAPKIKAKLPRAREDFYRHAEIVLRPGEQYTLSPNVGTGSRGAGRSGRLRVLHQEPGRGGFFTEGKSNGCRSSNNRQESVRIFAQE